MIMGFWYLINSHWMFSSGHGHSTIWCGETIKGWKFLLSGSRWLITYSISDSRVFGLASIRIMLYCAFKTSNACLGSAIILIVSHNSYKHYFLFHCFAGMITLDMDSQPERWHIFFILIWYYWNLLPMIMSICWLLIDMYFIIESGYSSAQDSLPLSDTWKRLVSPAWLKFLQVFYLCFLVIGVAVSQP